MTRLLHPLVLALTLAGAVLAQGEGHSPTSTLATRDEAASQQDSIGKFVDASLK